jgi:hypothetical protein
MPLIGPASALPIGLDPKNMDNGQPLHKFIKVALVKGQDMQNQNYSLVIDADWYTGEEGERVNGRSIDFDISQVMRAGGMKNCAAVYIDNGAGNGLASLEVLASGQRVTCPPNHQGWFPLIAPKEDGKFRIAYNDKYNGSGLLNPAWYIPASVTGGQFPLPAPFTVNMFFTDLAVPPMVWDAHNRMGYIPISGNLPSGPTNLTANVLTPLTGGPGNKRVGFRIRNAEFSDRSVIVIVDDIVQGSTGIWTLNPNDQMIFEGENTPYNVFNAFTTGVATVIEVFEVV